MSRLSMLLLACLALLSVDAVLAAKSPGPSPYAAVDLRNAGTEFDNLPGFTRSRYARDHALITPESRVYTGMFGWKDTNAAWFVTPAMAGSPQFSMYQALMRPGGSSGMPEPGTWRFVFVMDGKISVQDDLELTDGGGAASGRYNDLTHGHYAFFPADHLHKITSSEGASVLIYEKKYVPPPAEF